MLSATLLLAASMMVGQAGEASHHYEYLKHLDYFAGNWEVVGKVQVKGEFSGLDELAGAPLRQVMTYEWFKDKNFMVWTARDTPEAPISYQGVIGWDEQKKQIRSSDFNAQGAWLKYVHIKRDFGWVMEGTSVYPGGVEGVYRAEVKIEDDNHFRHEGKGTMKQEGKMSTVTLVFEATRK